MANSDKWDVMMRIYRSGLLVTVDAERAALTAYVH